MPVKPFSKRQPPEYATLVEELATEWKSPNSAAEEPVILEEKERAGKLVHIYVIWSKWSHLELLVRSEIIMDAAEKRFGREDLLNITYAMGLTPAEADASHISWR